MPGANESSTVEWHSAQVVPTRVNVSTPLTFSTVPLRPTTASRPSNATVTPGSFKSMRSEEHTSELQSLMRISYAVFCLKKKKYKLKTQSQSTTNHSNIRDRM